MTIQNGYNSSVKVEPNSFGSLMTYSVDGFRSLNGFELDLHRGVNVLVGPNGSGKTNFLEFLEFLSDTLRSGASTAVSRAGGLVRVFSIENARTTIKSCIKGIADFSLDSSNESEKREFRFQYDIELRYNKKQSVVYILQETIAFYKLYDPDNIFQDKVFVGKISIVRRNSSEDLRPTYSVGKRLLARRNRNPLAVVPKYALNRTPSELFERVDIMFLAPDESVLTARSRIPAFDAVRAALTRGRSFNISPSSVRVPDDILKLPGILTDGSGLTATLHLLQSIKKR